MIHSGSDCLNHACHLVTKDTSIRRIAGIQRRLEVSQPGASVSVGFAQLADDDTLETLIGRADSALYEVKANRRI